MQAVRRCPASTAAPTDALKTSLSTALEESPDFYLYAVPQNSFFHFIGGTLNSVIRRRVPQPTRSMRRFSYA